MEVGPEFRELLCQLSDTVALVHQLELFWDMHTIHTTFV